MSLEGMWGGGWEFQLLWNVSPLFLQAWMGESWASSATVLEEEMATGKA